MDFSPEIELVKLAGKENWATWKYNISIILACTEGAMKAVEGKLDKPVLAVGADDDEISVYDYAMEKYKRTESDALLLLTTNMTDETLKKVVRYSTAHEVWQELHFLFDDRYLKFFEREFGTQENSRQEAPVTTPTERQNERKPDEWLICVYCSEKGHKFQNCEKWIKDGDIPPMPTSVTSSSLYGSKSIQIGQLSLMANYDKVGAIVTDHVYLLLDSQEHMSRLPVPENSSPDTGTFIFASPEYDSKDTLLLLVHGSGVVRAGQWARSLIINENVDKLTQIPYIRKAVSKDYGVLVLNTNDNYRGEDKIPKSGSPDEHAQYVWDTYVAKTKATSILIAAHSYGGLVAMNLAKKNKKDFKNRVKAIALSDSVHGYFCKNVPSYVLQIAKNWVSSEQPLDAPERARDRDVPAVSAGHPKHEMTPYSCMDSVFKFFEEQLQIQNTIAIERENAAPASWVPYLGGLSCFILFIYLHHHDIYHYSFPMR